MLAHACVFFVSSRCPGLSSATPSVAFFLGLHPASFLPSRTPGPLATRPPSVHHSSVPGLTRQLVAGSPVSPTYGSGLMRTD